MTNTDTTTSLTTARTHTPSATGGLPDPRPEFLTAIQTTHDVLAAVRADQTTLPTPCGAFDVDALSGHVLAVLHRIGVVGSTGDFSSTPRHLDVPFAERIDESVRLGTEAVAAWSDDSKLATVVSVPWGQLPGAIALVTYVNELMVHSWDLATATGQQPTWNDDAVSLAYNGIQRGLPREGRSIDGTGADGLAPFGAVVDVADDAPLIDRLVAWNGRRP
ncbi:MAG: TIGR03086 family metal-binding protein [Ilumatobacteraceae bacterium]